MFSPYYILCKILKYLYDDLGEEVIDEWEKHVEPIGTKDTKFMIRISDDTYREEFIMKYISYASKALSACFDSINEIEVLER